MSQWTELSARERGVGLEVARRRQSSSGLRFSFVQADVEIEDPTVDASGRRPVSPKEYGFVIRGFEGGRTAWARDFANGTMLVMNREGQSHVLSQLESARIVFVDTAGRVLQDSALAAPPTGVAADDEQVVVRMTLSVGVMLHTQSPESVRQALMQTIDQAVRQVPLGEQGGVTVTECVFELSTVHRVVDEHRSDTDFSQLLDL